MANNMDEDQEHYIRQALKDMENDKQYNTDSSYGANASVYPDNVMTFTDKHLARMKAHPTMQPEHYLANLRLKTKKRS